jgi:hypothetical protein
MRAELVHVRGRRARWRFSVGCVWAAGRIQARALFGRRSADGGTGLLGLVLAGLAAALALAAYGLLHYPGLRSGHSVWASLSFFVALLFAYAVMALALSSSNEGHARVSRRYGLAGGLAVGAAWFVIFEPTSLLKAFVAVPLAVAVFGPACVAVLASRSSRDARVGTHAALWSGIVGGLLVFIVWVAATYLQNGRPYDAGLVRDFHRSGASDLATYAVGDDLGSGMVLLVLVPTVALALGSLFARLAARPEPNT